jgi:hypothetical protein
MAGRSNWQKRKRKTASQEHLCKNNIQFNSQSTSHKFTNHKFTSHKLNHTATTSNKQRPQYSNPCKLKCKKTSRKRHINGRPQGGIKTITEKGGFMHQKTCSKRFRKLTLFACEAFIWKSFVPILPCQYNNFKQ